MDLAVDVFDFLASLPSIQLIGSDLLDFIGRNVSDNSGLVDDIVIERITTLGVCELGSFRGTRLTDETILQFLFDNCRNRRTMDLVGANSLTPQFLFKLVNVRLFCKNY